MGDYKKFAIEMKRESSRFRLWKRGTDGAACILESYKNKRSVYFAVTNLLPSHSLMREEEKEYHLVLLGAEDGEIIHRDFGAFYVNHRGEGSIFKKFTGAEIECYTHCLFVALSKEDGGTETIFAGTTPFCRSLLEHEKKETGGFGGTWPEIFGQFFTEPRSDVFSDVCDETGCRWCRVEQDSPLPDPLLKCRPSIHTYGHYIIGKKDEACFVGIPGRFLQKEQPCREDGSFQLWQPIRGGETYFSDPAELTGALQEAIFGYWIAAIDPVSGEITPL